MIAAFGVLYFVLRPGRPVGAAHGAAHVEPDGTARAHVAVHLLGPRRTRVRAASRPLHKALSFNGALVAFALFTLGMLALAMFKSRYWDHETPWRRLTPERLDA